MSEEKKNKNIWVDAVARMIELTQQGIMRWNSVETTTTASTEQNRTSAIFQTIYNGKALRLYERKVPERRPISDEESNSFVLALPSILVDRKYKTVWIPEIVLEFVDSKEEPLWTFPQLSALHDLLTAVQYQAAGVNEFLHDLFSETNAAA
ncbi:MAG: hypothetical protein MSG64_04885 [Pyrinomonadaceae bacterium MAG19_C2-C3]|nr:hypothetical protein [Pyrinomonadaceae bacterium MAG19_C2-C3]